MEEVKYIPGDLVIDPFNFDKICVVKSTGHGSDAIFTEQLGTTNCAISYFKALSGIPLTEDILTKNNWKRNYNSEQVLVEDEPFYIYSKLGSIDLFYFPKDGVYKHNVGLEAVPFNSIKFVHQLQHLLFGLGLPSNLKV